MKGLITISISVGFCLHGAVTATAPTWSWYVAALALNMAILGCFIVALKQTGQWRG